MEWLKKPALPNLDVKRVLEDVQDMRADYQRMRTEWRPRHEIESTLRGRYEFLHDNYLSIWKMVQSESYDFNRLKYMLEMAKRVETKDIAEHDASVAVGERLVNEVVKPQLKSPSTAPAEATDPSATSAKRRHGCGGGGR